MCNASLTSKGVLFIAWPAVLSYWLFRHDPEAVPRTWGALCVRVEDGNLAKSIRDNCPQGVLHEAVLSLIPFMV